ncbi:MAG: FecR family protein [Saprospiraceae bacterium]|nr:FecR family protein [Candidatus Defluviibacterium haderslevense]
MACIHSCIYIFGSIFFTNSNNTIQIELVNAEVKSITLPDLSVIDINAKSSVNFKNKNFIKNRIVNLTGEAFFNVEKGSSFKVLTPYGTIEVLGTSFNVYARDSILEVECFTGKVSVNYNGNFKKYILLPGDKVNIYHEEVKITNKENSIQQIWKSGYFYFEETKLLRVLKELERQFDIKNIKTTVEIENKNYTGFFTKLDLHQALISICEPLQLRYQMVNDTLIIEQ